MTTSTDILNLYNHRRSTDALTILDEAIARAEREYDDLTLIEMLRAAKKTVRDLGRAWPERRRLG